MRRFSLLLSTIVVLALLLTACGGEQTSTSVPSTNVPPVTVEATETTSATEAPTEAATEAPTSGVPVTGENNPSRLSTMMNMPLFNQNNEQVGQVQDLVLDLDNTRVAYLVVSTSGSAGNKTVLVPWDSLQLQTVASTSATSQGNSFVLLADPNFLNNATDVDVTTLLPGMCQQAGTWDVDIRNFWESGAMPSSTQSANTPSSGTSATATSNTGTVGTESTATATSASGGTGAVNSTATPSTSTSNTQGQGVGQAGKVQGVVLASQVIGTTITFNNQGQGQTTAMPDTTATATTGGTGGAVATATSSTGGTGAVATATSGTSTGGTGTGNSSVGATQGTVQDVIVDTTTGDLQYLVITTSDDNTRWIPIPIGFLRCDSTTNGYVLMISPNALQNAPAFAEDQFPDTSTTGWDTEFSTFWQNNGGTSGTGTGGVTASTATPTP